MPKRDKKESLIFLKRLDLSSSISGDEQVAEVAHSSALKHLEFLSLRNCKVTSEGCTSLFESKHLRNLQVLLLPKNLIKSIKGPYDDLKSATEL